MAKKKCLNGFTLLELLVVLAIIGTLLALSAPHYFGSIDKAKETVLRENLNILRNTMDKYYSDTGRYPQSLAELVEKKYLRKIPEDPVTGSYATWELAPAPEKYKGQFSDVHSGAQGLGQDGSAIKEW